MIGRGHIWTAVIGACALWGDLGSGLAQQTEEERERAIKTAFLYNFALYVQWPKTAAAGDKDTFHFGVLGKDTLQPYLKQLESDKTVDKKKIVVHRFTSVKDYKPCHILFISSEPAGDQKESAEARLKAVLDKIKGAPVLVVGETDGLAKKGAMINFYIEENRVKFEVNLEAAQKAGVHIGSNVLRFGTILPKAKE